jgi:hypothetical protein
VRGDREWPLNDGHITHFRVVRNPRYGHTRIRGIGRAWRELIPTESHEVVLREATRQASHSTVCMVFNYHVVASGVI